MDIERRVNIDRHEIVHYIHNYFLTVYISVMFYICRAFSYNIMVRQLEQHLQIFIRRLNTDHRVSTRSDFNPLDVQNVESFYFFK